MYKYTFMHWVREEISTEDLFKHYKNEELSPDAHEAIRTHQAYVFTSFTSLLFYIRATAFTIRHSNTLAEDDLLDNEIGAVKTDIEHFKTTHSDVYTNIVSGVDSRFELTFEETMRMTTQPNTIRVEGTHIDILVKLKYLKWLCWFKTDRGNAVTEPDFKKITSDEQHSQLLSKHLYGWREMKERNKESSIKEVDKIDSESRFLSLVYSHVQPQIVSSYSYAKNVNDKEQGNSQNDKIPITYLWQGKQSEIDILYTQLTKEGFLPENTDKENFKALFTGKPYNNIQPVQWLKAKNLLAYFIDHLYSNDKFPDDTNIWSVAAYCFTDGNNLKQLRTNYQNNKNEKPKGFSAVDKILAALE